VSPGGFEPAITASKRPQTYALDKRWLNIRSRSTSQSRLLFGLCHNLFATLVRTIGISLAELFGSAHLCEEAFCQMKIIKSRYRNRLTNQHLHSIAFACTSVTVNLLSVSYRKICSVMHQIRNRTIHVKHLLSMTNSFILKIPISNK